MTKERICQLCTEEEKKYREEIFVIDDLILCADHAREYIHSEEYAGSSIYREKFDKLLNRMVFQQ